MKTGYCALIIFFILFSSATFSQGPCKIIYTERKNCINDSCHFPVGSNRDIIFVKGYYDRFLFSNKKVLQLKKQVLFYEEFDFFESRNNYGIYFFPVYVGQVGPYVTLNKQGIVILYSKESGKIKVIKGQGFYEKYFLCDSLSKHIEDTR